MGALSRGITNARHQRYSVRPIHVYHYIHVSAMIINALIVITVSSHSNRTHRLRVQSVKTT